MPDKQIIKNTEHFVKECLSGEGTGHDWWHIERVRNNAKLINKSEKANWFVVQLAVLLHDVGDRKVIQKDDDDFSVARNFLEKQKVEKEIVDQVMFIIQNMSFSKSFDKKGVKQSKEFQVVQDADRLDALGAIGIARAFAYGGSRSRPLYDPTVKAQAFKTTAEYRVQKSSTLHHFEEKLFKLKNLMNTKTAKKIALDRHNFMKKYRNRFLSEWKGVR